MRVILVRIVPINAPGSFYKEPSAVNGCEAFPANIRPRWHDSTYQLCRLGKSYRFDLADSAIGRLSILSGNQHRFS